MPTDTTLTCTKCKSPVTLEYATKPDGGLEFPLQVLGVKHEKSRCENPRKTRERAIILADAA